MRTMTYQGDNFHFDITGCGLDVLELALRVAFVAHNTVKSIQEIDGELVLFWTETDINNFPVALGFEAVFAIIKDWLAQAEYESELDHDGHNNKGWRVYNEEWGHVNDDWKAFCAIKPEWIMYGK